MADDENLVSQITVTGGNEAAAEVQSFADKSSAAFDKLDTAVNKSSSDISKSTDKIATASDKAATSIKSVATAANSSKLDAFQAQLGKLGDSISGVTSKFPQLAQAVGRFSQRLAAATAGVAAAGIGLAVAAKRVADQVDGTSNALEKQTQAQIDANNASLTQQQAYISLDSAQRKLFQDATQGKITWQQYSVALKALKDDFDEQQRVQAELRNATDATNEANQRLQQTLKDRTAFSQLIDTFGGPLLTSLTSFGRVVEQLRVSFVNNLGPAAASIIDVISGAISRNLPAINAFFANAAQKIQQLVTTQGPQLQKFFENVGNAVGNVFNGVIAAAPGIIDFFNNSLVPAVTKVAGIFQTLATAINFVFGTNLTGGSIVIIAILAQVTGSIRLINTLLKVFGATTKAAFAVLGEGALLLNTVFGGKFTAQFIKFTASVATGGGIFKTFFNIIKSGIPLFITLAEVVAVTFGIGFAPAVAIVIALGAALAFLLANTDWKQFQKDVTDAISAVINFFPRLIATFTSIVAFIGRAWQALWAEIDAEAAAAAQGVTDVWNAVLGFFSDLGSSISQFFSDAWTAIVAGVTTAVQAIEAAWNAGVALLQQVASAIGTAFSTVWDNVVSAVTTAVKTVTDTWNTVVDFFNSLPGTLQAVWDTISSAITNAFNSAVQRVIGFFQSAAATIRGILQPIIDLINTISTALASAEGNAQGGAAGFAGGGKVRGPGGPTADQIPAWLSNGEWVMRAKAVAKYGYGFMRAVNEGRFQIPKLALGGFASIAPSPVPRMRFAEGGAAVGGSKMRPLSLTIDGNVFDGLLAPEDVGEKMTKFAIARQTRSAGRKPAWIGNRRN